MKIFGIEFGRKRKAALPALSQVDSSRGWFNLGVLGGPGNWLPETWFQQDVQVRPDLAYANWCVFSCMTLIAGDMGKVCLELVEEDADGVWTESYSPSFSPVLQKPNRYQTRQMFIEQWVLSKLSTGNTYVLKERDKRGVVVAMYVLDPRRVLPLVALDGSVYYQLHMDYLAGIPEGMPAIPASEIIHDRFNCLFHPLVGLSPLYASALAATQGLRIQQQSAKFFENGARPSGIITAPAQISEPTAERIKKHWETGYSGENRGKVAVLGDGLKFEPMTQNAVDSEVVKQLGLTAVMVCATFHVPPHVVGAAEAPRGASVEALELQYYSKALQPHFESIEALLDDGLGLTTPKVGGTQYGTYFELDDLLKMDQASMMATLKLGVDGSILAPNDARRRINLKPAKGGDSPMSQQQNYSLEALAQRDADKPFAKPSAGASAAPAVPATPPADTSAKAIEVAITEFKSAEQARTSRAEIAEAERKARADAESQRAADELTALRTRQLELTEAARLAAERDTAAIAEATRVAIEQAAADEARQVRQAEAMNTLLAELRSREQERIEAGRLDAEARAEAERSALEAAASAQAHQSQQAEVLRTMVADLKAERERATQEKAQREADDEAARVFLDTIKEGLEHV